MIKMTEQEFRAASNSLEGVCLACGEPTCSSVEPDAENYKCESCGENEVFGYEQALLMGFVEIVEE